MRAILTILVGVGLCATSSVCAVLNFDGLSDGDSVTNQFAASGATFQNAIALTAGVGLNEFEFPPRSNFNVISDNGAPITIDFSSPLDSIFAYFTYAQGITMEAFDSGSSSLGTVSSAGGCASNMALSGTAGCLPNEQLSLSGIGAISRVTITGNPAGGSFVMDDLNFTTSAGGPNPVIPEPATILLSAGGLAMTWLLRRRSA